MALPHGPPPSSLDGLTMQRAPSARAVFDRVSVLLHEKFAVAPGALSETARLVLDLGVDPLDLQYFALALEEEFDVDITEAEATQLTTVHDAVVCVVESYSKSGES